MGFITRPFTPKPTNDSRLEKKEIAREKAEIMRNLMASEIFFKYCLMCGQEISETEEMYMYEGDKPFCSEECREQQILKDEKGLASFLDRCWRCSASISAGEDMYMYKDMCFCCMECREEEQQLHAEDEEEGAGASASASAEKTICNPSVKGKQRGFAPARLAWMLLAFLWHIMVMMFTCPRTHRN